jgi:hypothetical protein
MDRDDAEDGAELARQMRLAAAPAAGDDDALHGRRPYRRDPAPGICAVSTTVGAVEVHMWLKTWIG